MSSPQLEPILAYASIPAFVILLAILLFFVMRSQLGLFAPRPAMPTVSKGPRTSFAGYALVGTLFLLFIVMAVISRKQQVPA